MQIRRHNYSGYFDFIILFVGMNMSFFAINLDIVSLFANLFFFIFSGIKFVLEYDVLYKFQWMNIFYFSKKNIATVLEFEQTYF
jgi:hypothetical protein